MSRNEKAMKNKSLQISDFDGLVRHLASDDVKLSKRLQQVAQFVLNNPEDVAIYNIVELAEMAKVPTSTITRFVKELGFSGFSDLQSVFRQRLIGPKMRYADRVRALSKQNLTSDLKDFDLDSSDQVFNTFVQAGMDALLRLQEEVNHSALENFVKTLAGADCVHIIAARGAFGVGMYCYYGFSQVGKPVRVIDNQGSMRAEQMRFIGDKDVVLAMTFDNYTQETVEMVHEAAKRGAKLLVITDNELSPVSLPNVETLYVKEAHLGHFRSQVPLMTLCQSIIVSVGRRIDRGK